MPKDLKLHAVAAAICSSKSLTLRSEVGSGAFKRAFEVQTPAGEALALKVYMRAGGDARTEREVDAITRCSHPGIVQFRMIARWSDGADEYLYSLEEFLRGGTLTSRLQAGLLTPSELRALAVDLVDSVGHIASLGLVHRDLKPDNIMFRTVGGRPVVVDFGLVRDLNQTSLTKTWLPQGPCTPFFAAPEQLNNDKALIDWRADQFALGVVLAMCGLGQHPYATAKLDAGQIVDRVARREQPSSEFAAWANGNSLAPIVKMVAPWPISRFRTPAQLAEAWKSMGGL